MADTTRNFSNQPLDLKKILEVAQHRWLRPAEICEILRNHQKFYLAPKPPVRPPGGSMFLFDRKVLRYFRKDGHSWRKKKDGKTVNEAHEKLKDGSIDVLHCYYAHGEDNKNFQRRSYWMLEEQLEHIVLVHYREVKEGYRVGASRLQYIHPVPQLENPQSSSTPPFESGLIVQEVHTSSPSSVDLKEQALSSDVFCSNYKENEEDPLLMPASGHFFPINSSFSSENQTGLVEFSRDSFQLNPQISSFMSTDIHSSDRKSNVTVQQKFYSGHLKVADLLSNKLNYARLDAGKAVKDVTNSRNRLAIISGEVLEENILVSPAQTQNISSSQTVVTPDAAVQNSSLEGGVNGDEAGSLKKLDSFGRWMDRQIGGDHDESLMASDSAIYWNSLDTDNGDKEVSSSSRHMQLDIDSLSQEQLFSISDFAPDWVYSGVETKVLIIGTFLGHGKHPTCQKWSCMFGEVEVSAEVLTRNIIRCQIPSHAPGRVPFYVTCSNRLACSEVREFEYRTKTSELAPVLRPSDEVCLQVRLAKLLYSRLNRKFLDCSIEECEKCKLKTLLCSLKCETGNASERLDDLLAITEGNHINFRDVLIQNFLKDKLHEWLVYRAHEEDKGPNILDEEGQGVIHLVAALGYEWGLLPLISAGISPNFRDARGRTALHWAAHYGREDMVIALVKLGVAAGAVDDPTAALPGGQTAADLASSRGHKGIAGYLAESDLTNLQSLVINNNALDNISAGLEAEKGFESAALEVVPLNETIHDDFCLKGSLASLSKSAHAAALIQAAFRARSFRQRQLTESRNNVSEVSVDLVALGSLNKVQKVNHFEDYLHSAAIKIQHKYRGWKGRREFLKMRNQIVKVQAHFRGHQVRKQYKKFVWSVSIVEKAILRWRRKKPGLRGYQPEKTCQNGPPEFEKNDEYEFLSIGHKLKSAGVEKALARVQSMVRHPEARDQYMRLVAKFEGSKLDDRGSSK